MKYRVKILKQPKYQNGGRTLGDFSNLTEDQLQNGPVYGFNEEPEEIVPVNNSVSNNRPTIEALQSIPYVMKQPDREPMVTVPVSVLQSLQQPKSKSINKSIVDTLTNLNLPSSFSFRKKLAAKNNIKNYTGTAAQNLKLISLLDNQVNISLDEEPVRNAVTTTKSNNVGNNKKTNNNTNVKNTKPIVYSLPQVVNSNNPVQLKNVNFSYKKPLKSVMVNPVTGMLSANSQIPVLTAAQQRQSVMSAAPERVTFNNKNNKQDPYLRIANKDPFSEAGIARRMRKELVTQKAPAALAAAAAIMGLGSLIPTVTTYPLLRGLPRGPQGRIPGPRNMPTAPPKGWTTGSGMQSPGFPFYQDGGGMEQEEDGQSQVLQIIQAFAEANGVDPRELMTKLQSLGEEEQQQAITQMYQALQGGQEGGQEEEQGYAQEEMQPEMGYNEEDDMREEDPYAEDPYNEEDDMRQAAYGGQMGYGLDLGSRRLWMNQDDDEQSVVNRSIKEVPRDQANIEAEGGETALIPNKNDNGNSHFNIQGNRHTEGGVPLNVPEGTFIYSDTKKMKLGGSVLSVFGKSDKTNKKYTPAALAKQYDLNKYTAILESPKSSQIQRRTAELMIQNYNKKLAQLALVQEGKKGYPQGIPKVAEEYYAKTKAYVESQQAKNQPQQEIQEQQSDEDVDQDMEQGEQMQAMYGMGFKYGGGLQKFQGAKGGSQVTNPNSRSQYLNTGTSVVDLFKDKEQNSSFGNRSIEAKRLGIPNYRGTARQNMELIKKMNGSNPSNASSSQGQTQGNIFMPAEDDSLPTPPANLVYKNSNPYEYDNSNVVEDPNSWGAGNKEMNVKKEVAKEDAVDKSNLKYGWTNPDKLNLLNSYINLASVRRATPFEPTVKFQRPETRYADPSRALAANAEQYNAARQAAAMFAGPQSRYSFNAGQFGKNAADIIGQYATQNVQAGNIAANQAADINNKQIAYDAQRTKRLYDAGVIGEQQYQNAMKQARAAVLQSYMQGTKNATDLYNMSMTESPYYDIDKNRGAGLVRFVKGKEANFFGQKANDNSSSDYVAMTKAGFSNFDDWSKNLGYASYDQLLKARIANAKTSAKK